MTKKKLKEIVSSTIFRILMGVLGILFFVLTYFITITPDAFLKYSYLGIFIFNVISSGLLLMPILIERFNLFGVVVVSALGNIPNTSISYLLGNSSNSLFTHARIITKAKDLMKRFGLYAVFLLAILPLPLDINGLLSGYLGIPYRQYIIVNFLGKVVIFLLTGLGVITLSQTMQK